MVFKDEGRRRRRRNTCCSVQTLNTPQSSGGLPKPAKGSRSPTPHPLCATPLKYIKHFPLHWLPATQKCPAHLLPPKRVPQYLPLPYQKVATARSLRCSAPRWWSLNKQPDDLTPNILGSLWAAFMQTTETFKQAL